MYSCHDDSYAWFDIELKADNTIIDILQIMEINFKYYFCDKQINLPSDFYFPPRQYLAMSRLNTKEKVKNSFIWKICKMLTRQEKNVPDLRYGDLDDLLDFINWDYIQDSRGYEESHCNYMWNEPNDMRTN